MTEASISTPPQNQQPISPGCRNHLVRVRAFYETAPVESGWFVRQYRKLLAHYYTFLIPADASVIEIGCGSGELLSLLPNRDMAGVDLSERQIERARQRIPHGTFFVRDAESFQVDRSFDFIILSDTINLASDVQSIFQNLLRISHPRTRLILNYHSNLWRPLFALTTWLGLKPPSPATNWLTTEDVQNLLMLADWEALKVSPKILMPVPLLGFDAFVNRYLAPLLPWFCLSVFVIARPERCLDRAATASPSWSPRAMKRAISVRWCGGFRSLDIERNLSSSRDIHKIILGTRCKR